MIIFFLGSDLEKINKLIDSKISESGAKDTLRFLEEKEISFISDYLYDEDIFGNRKAIVCRNCLENPNSLNFLLDKSLDFQKSQNIFIFIEKKIKDPAKIKKISNEFIDLSEKEEKDVNKIFLLATFIEKKDRKNAWFSLQEIRKDYSIEQVLGIVKWKILSMLENYKFRNTYEKDKLVLMLKDIVFMFNNIHQDISLDGYDEMEGWILKHL